MARDIALIEAEILCAMRIADLPRRAAAGAGELVLEEPRPKQHAVVAEILIPYPAAETRRGFFFWNRPLSRSFMNY